MEIRDCDGLFGHAEMASLVTRNGTKGGYLVSVKAHCALLPVESRESLKRTNWCSVTGNHYLNVLYK